MVKVDGMHQSLIPGLPVKDRVYLGARKMLGAYHNDVKPYGPQHVYIERVHNSDYTHGIWLAWALNKKGYCLSNALVHVD